MFESLPTHPDAGRYWDMVQRHKINIFYTAPTAIRALMKFGTVREHILEHKLLIFLQEHIKKYDLSSLRILGSVGEPINPAAWEWYYREVGNERCAIVDTYWQTETGMYMNSCGSLSNWKRGNCHDSSSWGDISETWLLLYSLLRSRACLIRRKIRTSQT